MGFEDFKYNISVSALADELGCSQDEARGLVDNYKIGNFFDFQDWLVPGPATTFEPPARVMAWHQNYMLLKEYIASAGRFPNFNTVYKGVRLGTWLRYQKTAYKAGKLSPARESLLRSLGVMFRANHHDFEDAKWRQNYALLEEYVSLKGHLPPTTPYFTHKGVNLGIWLSKQKQAQKAGKLSHEQEALLRSVGVDFDVSEHDKAWQQNYDLLKEYISSKNSLPEHTTIYKDTKIGPWLVRQKQRYKAGKLSPEREALLRSVGVDFEASVFETQWQRNYELLKEYISIEGHLPPQSTVYNGVNLGTWLAQQKKADKAGVLPSARKALLCSLGLDFETDKFEAQWHQNYNLFKEYVSAKGHLPARRTIFKGVRLGNWLTAQKVSCKEGRLLSDREALLRSIGVDFDVSQEDINEAQWHQNFALFKEYVDLFGQNPPTTSSFTYKGARLGDWLHRQKTAYKTGELSHARETLLRSAGIDFKISAHDKAWHQNFALLKEYVAVEGHLPPFATIYKGVNLGFWLNAQKTAYKAGKLSPERETLLHSVCVELKSARGKEYISLAEQIASAEAQKQEPKTSKVNREEMSK